MVDLVWFLGAETEVEVVLIFFLIGFESLWNSNILLLLTLLFCVWSSLCAPMNERVKNTKTRHSTKSTLVNLQECRSGAICADSLTLALKKRSNEASPRLDLNFRQDDIKNKWRREALKRVREKCRTF